MLQGDFFTISDLEVHGFDIKVELLINAHHKIFEGHFPNRPVVPGVCMMQMVKEIMEHLTGKKTDLTKAHEMKFLAVIDPRQNNAIQAILKYTIQEGGEMLVSATLFKDGLIHFKFKGLLSFREPALLHIPTNPSGG